MKALVIGADGFVGRHLVSHLRDAGDEVVEAVGPAAEGTGARLPIDVRDPDSVRSVVEAAAPEAIYHLAAVAYGPDATADAGRAVQVTVGGTVSVIEAAAHAGKQATVLVTGSSEVYGGAVAGPLSEDAPLQPTNVYGATKVAQEALALALGRAMEVPVVVTRAFNHIGPGQRPSFAVASFARQLRMIERRAAEPVLRVGNLDPVRDFTDVRDVVRAYRLLVSGGHVGMPVNVASGVGRSIHEILDTLVEQSGLGARIEIDPTRVRRDDPPRIVGDSSRLRQLTRWGPEISLRTTLRDIWSDAQERW